MRLLPKTATIAICCAAAAQMSVAGSAPEWLETDSAYAINYRLHRDFPYLAGDLATILPDIDREKIDEYVDSGYIESLAFGDTLRFHKKLQRNVALLAPELSSFGGRGSNAKLARRELARLIVDSSKGDGALSNGHRITYRFTIDVPTVDCLRGDTLRVWMPVPLSSTRQKNVEILSSSPGDVILNSDSSAIHGTIFFSRPVAADTTRFEYVAQYDVYSQYFSPQYIADNLKPYNKESDLYRRYTSLEQPHIVDIPLARQLTEGVTDPWQCSEIIYDYISRNYPWAGAREYSTIPCIPEYVINQRHGDCGQVSLLYISMMRSLGIPARWESGWMLHPGEKNLHDWAEVYFEGVGWVPVDMSFGRYSNDDDSRVAHFYSTGIDWWRLAANRGVNGQFYPSKKFLRSETVDSQMGEVECSKGNLFYPGWNQHLEILKIEPLK